MGPGPARRPLPPPAALRHVGPGAHDADGAVVVLHPQLDARVVPDEHVVLPVEAHHGPQPVEPRLPSDRGGFMVVYCESWNVFQFENGGGKQMFDDV